uniref:Globin family profile domain-containing protein n=1 Tax=Plectus sambesii TaxID=2011161 RepID=A0A914UMA9_9BILA
MGNKPTAGAHNGRNRSLLGAIGAEPSVRPALSAIPRALLLEPNKLLSVRQRQLIVKLWKRTRKSGLDSVGTKIFLQIFEGDPRLKKLFSLEHVPKDLLKYETRFQAHAHTFTRTIAVIVTNIHDLEAVARYMQDLGKRHAHFQVGGFEPEQWELFAEALSECVIEGSGGGGRETATAWRLLVAFLIEEMRLGFGERLKDCAILQHQRAHSGSCPAIVSPREARAFNY